MLPFSLTKRKESKFYYVRFKDEQGNYLSWKSTKEQSYDAAVKKGWEMYYSSTDKIEKQKKINSIKNEELTAEDVAHLLSEFKKKGLIKSYTITGSKSDIKAIQYCYDFWDIDKSDYLKEKKRKNKRIHQKHCNDSIKRITKYWTDILGDKYLSDVTKDDIKKMFDILDKSNLNGNTKNHIIRAVLTPFKYAYGKELIDKDLCNGWIFYKPEYKKVRLLDKEVVIKLFSHEWKDKRSMLANAVAMCTGMRAEEILSLTIEDIGEDCIYINHSWNPIDKLKSTKTDEARIKYISFPSILRHLVELGKTNPYTEGRKYIFYARIPDQPLDEKVLLKSLRHELQQIGFTEEEAKQYKFHAWRHFYTTYMKGNLSDKLLKTQTGHKSLEMLEHYSNHALPEDVVTIKEVQRKVFSDFIF